MALIKYLLCALLLIGSAHAAEIDDLNVTDASNTGRFPENMAPSAVNDGARALEGMIARWYQDTNGSLSSGGSSSAYTLSINSTDTLYDGQILVFDANHTNTGAATLNVTNSGGSAQGAVAIKKFNDVALAAGDIEQNQKVVVVYDGTNFQMLNPAAVADLRNVVEDTTPQLGGDLDLNGNNIDFPTTANISDVLDQDDMSSDSATALATQQSIKAYVDAEINVIVLGTEQPSTGGTEVDFGSIPSGVKRLTIMFDGVSTSGADELYIQLGDSGGVETSGYVGGAGDGAGAVVSTTSAFQVTRSHAATSTHSGSITLHLEDDSDTWTLAGVLADNVGSFIHSSAGRKSTSGELTTVRITTSGGSDTFDAGAINIQYES